VGQLLGAERPPDRSCLASPMGQTWQQPYATARSRSSQCKNKQMKKVENLKGNYSPFKIED
jgi:hypothetical protein